MKTALFYRHLTAALALPLSLVVFQAAQASSATWLSSNSGTWSASANWSTGAVPGAADTASFTSASAGSPVITVTGSTTIGGLDFSSSGTTPNNYIFTTSSGTFVLSSGANVTAESSYVGDAAFTSQLTLAGSATFTANEALGGGLGLNSIIAAPSTSATVTLNGTNTSYFNALAGAATAGTGGSISLVKTGSGLWTLGSNVTSVTDSFTSITLNGGTLTVLASGVLTNGTINVTGDSTLRLAGSGFADLSGRITIGDTDTLTIDTTGATTATWTSAFGTGTNKTGGLTKAGLNSLILSGAQNYTGATTINAGSLSLVEPGSTENNLLSASSSLVLGGGVLNVKGGGTGIVSTQTFNGTTLNPGISEFTPNSGTGNVTTDFGSITRNSGALFYITSAGTYTEKATGSSNDANGVLNGVIYSNGFASVSGGVIGNVTTTTQNSAASWTSASANYATGAAVSGSTGSGTVSINTLLLNNASSQSFTIGGTLAVADGLAFGSSIGANASTISGGTLTSTGTSDLIIYNNDSQNTYGRNTISSVLADSGTGTHTNVILFSGVGTMYISGANTYTGNTYVAAGENTGTGTVTIGGAAGAQIGSANATVFVNGGNQGASSTLRVGNGDATGNILGTVEVDDGILSLDRSDTNTLTASVTGTGGAGIISLDGAGSTTLNFTGTNTFYSLRAANSSTGTLVLTGANSFNTFISPAEFAAGFTAGSTTNFNSGTYIFQTPGNSSSNSLGTWDVTGATVDILNGRYLPSSGTNTFSVSAGSLNFEGDRFTPGDLQTSGGSFAVNVSGTGTLNIATATNSGSIQVGLNYAGNSQDSTSKDAINQTGGVVNIGVDGSLGQPVGIGSNLTIGNGYSEIQSSYNLQGGILRDAGTIQGVAATAATATVTTTAGSNTITVNTISNLQVGQVITGDSNLPVGDYVTGFAGTNTIVLSAAANVSGAVTTSTFTQPTANLNRLFSWTSGTLTAGGVNMTNLAGSDAYNAATVGTLFQGGGVLAPGDTYDGATFTGKTTITGNYQLDSGFDLFTLGGSTAAAGFHSAITSYDTVAVTGTATLSTGTLGGGIEVGLVNGEGGNITNTSTSFNVLTASTVTGTYNNLNAAGRADTLDRSLTFKVNYGTGTVSLTSWKDPAIISLTGSNTLAHDGANTLPYTLTNAASTGNLPLPSDNLYYTLSGSVSGTGTLAPGASLSGGSTTITAGTATYTVTATDPNALVQGDATNALDSATATFTVTGYTGQGVWNKNTGGSWGTLNGTGTQTFANNWVTLGGSPGLDPNYKQSDSATFGTSVTGTANVTLDGANPYLNAITFSTGTGSFNIAQGSSGTVNLDSTTTATITVTQGNDTISAPVEIYSNAATSVAGGSTLTISGNIGQYGDPDMTFNGPGTTILSGSNTYSNATVASGTLQLSNTAGSATGTGNFAVNGGATLAGTGISSGNSFAIVGSGTTTATAATVLVGHNTPTDLNTSSSLTLVGSANPATSVSPTIQNANLVFNLSATTAGGLGTTPSGSGDYLAVGSSAVYFGSGVTLTLDLQGEPAVIPANTPYVLVAGTDLAQVGASSSQYGGLTFGTSTGSLATGLLTQITGTNVSLAFGTTADSSFYGANSYLFLYQNSSGVDDIEVEVVPEPSTWALMFGGLAALIVWQRRRRQG